MRKGFLQRVIEQPQNMLNDDNLQSVNLLNAADYVAALDRICANAKSNLFIFDRDFLNGGFNSETRFEHLKHFLLSNPKNRLHLLAHDVIPLSQHCPRLMLLARQFNPAMLIHQTPKNLQHISAPFAVTDEGQYTRRFHFNDTRGLMKLNDNEGAHLLKVRFTEMWAASQPHIATASFIL